MGPGVGDPTLPFGSPSSLSGLLHSPGLSPPLIRVVLVAKPTHSTLWMLRVVIDVKVISESSQGFREVEAKA